MIEARDRVDCARDRMEDVVTAAVDQAQSTSAKALRGEGRSGEEGKNMLEEVLLRLRKDLWEGL